MAGFSEKLKRSLRAASSAWNPGRYQAEGKQVICAHCGNDAFAEGSALLNTAGMTFLGLDWANRKAYTLMCSSCGRIEWWGQRPDLRE